MPSLEETLFQALEEERKLSEERALLPGLLQHDLANVLCQVSLAASMATLMTTEGERARYLRDVEGGVRRADREDHRGLGDEVVELHPGQLVGEGAPRCRPRSPGGIPEHLMTNRDEAAAHGGTHLPGMQ